MTSNSSGTPAATTIPSAPEGAEAATIARQGVRPAARDEEGAATHEEIRIPIVEERLVVDKRQIELGELVLRKTVDEREERTRQPVMHEELEVERVAVNRPLEAAAQRRTEGDWLIIPVMEEVVVVRTQLMLKEEIRIRTRQVMGEQEVVATTRHERVELDEPSATS